MGFSVTVEAARAMDAVEAACAASRTPYGEVTSNVFFANGRRYFYEVTRRDQPDGGIAGTVFLAPPGSPYCIAVGRFRIAGAGRVIRGPALFRRAKPHAGGRWGR
jgi:hypothetical protein